MLVLPSAELEKKGKFPDSSSVAEDAENAVGAIPIRSHGGR